MEIYKKLQAARAKIKESPVKKEGKNTYSGYEYFTPSQISRMVHEVCMEFGLIHIYRLEKNSEGYLASLYVVNIEDYEDSINFVIPTSIPEIKATNSAQQLGGAVTYSERYLLMIAFDIVDNNLDFDTTENTEKTAKSVDTRSKVWRKIKETTPEIPEITNKFDFSKWDKTFDYNGRITYNGKQYFLSEKARAQLDEWIEEQMEAEYFEQQRKQDI